VCEPAPRPKPLPALVAGLRLVAQLAGSIVVAGASLISRLAFVAELTRRLAGERAPRAPAP